MENKQTFSTIIDINSKAADAEFNKLEKHLNKLKDAKNEAFKAGDTKTWKSLNREIVETEKQMSIIKGKAETFKNTLRDLDKATPKELRQTLKDINNEINSGRVVRGSKEWNEYQEALRAVKSELKEIKDESKVLSNDKGNFLKNLVPNGLLNTLSKAGAAITGIVTAAKTAIAGLQEAWGRIKVFVEYNMQIEQANRLTREFLGLTGDDLRATRAEIQAIADTYGKSFQDVLAGVDTLMAQYDIAADEAARVIRDGFQAGADLNNDMLQKIQQYSPAFRDAGISANELLGIIQQTRSGIFTDAGMNAIQTAAKRIREMSPATKEALDNIGIASDELQARLADGSMTMMDAIKLVSTQLKTLPDNSQEVGEVLKDVFGRQGANAGIKLIEQLDTMNTDLNSLKDTTGEYGELLEEQVATNERLNTRMSEVFGTGENGFEELKIRGGILLTKVLVKIIEWFVDAYNNIGSVRKGIAALAATWKTFVAMVKGGFNIIKDLVAGTADLFLGLGKIIDGVFTFDSDKIKNGWNQLTKGLREIVVDTAKDIMGTVGETIDAVVTEADKAKNNRIGTDRTTNKNKVTGYTLDEVIVKGNGKGKNNGNTTNGNSPTKISRGQGALNKPTTPTKEEDPYQQELKEQEAALAQMKLNEAYRYAEGIVSFREYTQTMQEAETEHLQTLLDLAAKYGKDTTQAEQRLLDDRNKQEEEARRLTLDQIEQNYQATRAYLEAAFYDQKSSLYQNQTLLNQALAMAEEDYIQTKIEQYREGTAERQRLELQLEQQRQARVYQQQQEAEQRLAQLKQEYLKQSLDSRRSADLQNLEELHTLGLLSETQYQEALKAIRERYDQEHRQTQADKVQKTADQMAQYIQTVTQVTSAASSYFQAQAEAEIAAVERRYDKEIEAAGSNEKKRKRLEEKKEKEIAAIKNKANKRAMAVELAQAFASTALAAINAYSSGAKISPVYGAISAAAATAAGMLQIATIKKQHEAQQKGYYEGGYTSGSHYRRVAGIVHEGEFVANHTAVNNRNIRPLLDAIDLAQRNNTIASLSATDLMQLAGYRLPQPQATGNTTANNSPANLSGGKGALNNGQGSIETDRLLVETLTQLNQYLARPLPAIVTIEGETGVAHRLEQYNQMRENT